MTELEVINLIECIERISVLEVKVGRLDHIENKLDELIELRHKGLGAFWLASSLLGTGLVGSALALFEWFKGH